MNLLEVIEVMKTNDSHRIQLISVHLSNNIKNYTNYMKIKDLLSFNPEAELQLLGTNYIPADLSIYGWGYGS